jgi:hypothetical protein
MGLPQGSVLSGFLFVIFFSSLIQACRAEFTAELLALTDAWEASDPVGRVDELHALIADDVATDRRKHYTTADFESHVACVRAWVAARPDALRAWAAGE